MLISLFAAIRNRLWNSTGFFLLVWGVHYLPFFLMGRQLFIHHYLPSHFASALVAGSVLHFVLSETVNYPISIRGPATKAKPTTYADLGFKAPIIVGVFALAMFILFSYIAPLTYGTPGYDLFTLNNHAAMLTWFPLFLASMVSRSTPNGCYPAGPCTSPPKNHRRSCERDSPSPPRDIPALESNSPIILSMICSRFEPCFLYLFLVVSSYPPRCIYSYFSKITTWATAYNLGDSV